MTLSLNQAQDIVQKLSNDQLMQAYTSGTIPQFVVFSEMQRRQQMQNASAKMPTETVAEKMVGREEQGIPAAMPQEPPQMAAKGGPTRASTLSIGARNLPEGAIDALKMRYEQMKELEDLNDAKYADGGEVEAPPPSSGSPITNKDIARMIMPSLINVESGGNQGAVSKAGARGVAQLMPGTAPEAAKFAGLPWDHNKYINDAKYNADLGHAYLARMLDRFGDREKALAAYNAGPGRVSLALDKAQSSGKDWKSFLPRETQAYIGKVLGGAQAQLPERQEPEGPDAYKPPYAYDGAFLPKGLKAGYSGFEYPKKEDSNLDKGLAALKAAQTVKGLRFAEGSEGEPVDGDIPDDSDKYPDYTPSPSLEERLKRAAIQKKINEAPSSKPKEPSFIDRVRGSFKPPVDLATAVFGSRTPEQDKDANPPEILPTQVHGSAYSPPPRKEMTDYPRAPEQYNYSKPDVTINDTYQYDKPVPQEDQRTGGVSPFTGSEPPPGSPEYRQAEDQLAKMQPPRQPRSGGGVGGGAPVEDQGFASVMKQVQDAIGSKINDEFIESKKKYQETMASMKNDKVVDTLLAAAKTLAGQRVGQQNFGDALANAGIAAQEAQKRMYKADEDMRKYRAELMKAQDENNYRAAAIAMNKIIQSEHDKKSLQVAAMQADRAHRTAMDVADRDDKRIAAAQARQQERLASAEMLAKRKEIVSEIKSAEDLIKSITPKANQVDIDPEGTKRRILEAQSKINRLKKELQSIGSGDAVETPDQSPSIDDLQKKYGIKL